MTGFDLQRGHREESRDANGRIATQDVGHLPKALVAACLATVVVRLVYAWQPLRSDEAGYLLIARTWGGAPGEFLYGDHHVDRPPLLLAIYRLAALWEWDGVIRLLAIPFVLVAIGSLARATFLTAGRVGATWTVVVATALLNSPALGADQANGAVFAVTFVAASVAAMLNALVSSTPRAQYLWGATAGFLAAAAVLVKQNFVEGIVFALVVVVVDGLRRGRISRAAARLGAGFGLGVLGAGSAVLAWLLVYDGSWSLYWADVARFRSDALTVIWAGHLDAPLTRAATLLLLAFLSVLLPLAWLWCRRMSQRGPAAGPVEWAVTAMLAVGTAAMVLGGSYWPHYLLQVAPATALAAGIAGASRGASGRRARHLSRLTAWSAVVASTGTAVVYLTFPVVWWPERTGQWLAGSARTGDTGVVFYGYPSVLEAADLPSPYPYLWSLPMRTLDPHHRRLHATLEGASAPAWVVQVNPLSSWDIDDAGVLRSLLQDRYRTVAEVCGHVVWLRADLERDLARAPDC